MIDKNQQIENLKEIQAILKTEISSLKTKRPTFLIGFLFIMVVLISFLESRVYQFFGNGMNFIKFEGEGATEDLKIELKENGKIIVSSYDCT